MKRKFINCWGLLRIGSLLILSSLCMGQNLQETVSGNFSGISFDQLVERIESQADYRFYYDKRHTDSLKINLGEAKAPIRQLLEQAFAQTALQFAAAPTGEVFITQDRALQMDLAPGFFKVSERSATEQPNQEIVIDFYEERMSAQNDAEAQVYEIGRKTTRIRPGNSVLRGRISDAETGEPIVGAAIFIEKPLIGATSDPFGNYRITLPRGKHQLKASSLGMRTTERTIILYGDGQLDLELVESVQSLKEVVVEADRDANLSRSQMGIEKMDIKTIKQMPSAMGEADILRAVLTLPGVTSVGEASTGFNVRGGSTDQNLILLNNAVIYNPSHLFGFFSSFNPDVLKDVQLYKSSIPARYGGRLSSVLDVTTREGNKKKFTGSGGIGPITGRLTLEGPLAKEKSSFLIGARANYSNWLLRQLENEDFNRSEANFYDVNLGVNHEFSPKSSLSLSGYYSQDEFRLQGDTVFDYSNQNLSATWKKSFGQSLYAEFSAGYSRYSYGIGSSRSAANAYRLDFAMRQTNLQADFNYYLNEQHEVRFGISSIQYKLSPGSYRPNSGESLVVPEILQAERGIETALYLSDEYSPNDKLTLTAGLRYSLYNLLGPGEENVYAPGQPRSDQSLQETRQVNNGEIAQTYHGPEVRLAARYSTSPTTAVKLSYNLMRQYIHMLSNTTAIAPTDIWKLSDTHVRPQIGQQVSLGLYKNFRNSTIEASVEGYYKRIQHFLDFKSGAELVMNEVIEQDLINTRGRAYGVEVMLKKPKGKLNGWIGYTYSRTLLQQDDPIAGELINRGEWYPANFDKPHDLTMVSNYRFSHRFSTSLNFTYSTGRPITLPIAQFNYGGSDRVFYSDRNAFRIPDYYRLDFSMNIEGNHKVQKLAHSSWTLAVFNLTGRRNPYSVFFVSEEGQIKGYQLSIFGQPIPTITYNFKF